MARRGGYYRRWHAEHPRVSAYLTREEYERLRAEAERLGVSLSDLARRKLTLDLRGCVREAYGAGLRDGALCALAAVASGYLDAAALLGRPGEAALRSMAEEVRRLCTAGPASSPREPKAGF